MKDLVCNYAPIRFLPYRETAEFVNIGVLIYCPQIDYLDYKIESRKRRRIRNFFPELDLTIFATSVCAFSDDLAHRQRNTDLQIVGTRLNAKEAAQGIAEFNALVRPRESLVTFGEVGTKSISDPRTALEELFERFVLRRFAQTKDYQETWMRLRLAKFLREWKIRKYYKYAQIGDEDYKVSMPFVLSENETPQKAIKPLDLRRKDTNEIFEHGGVWVQRLRRLEKHGGVPQLCLFPVNLPETGTKENTAAVEICTELREAGGTILSFKEKSKIRRLLTASGKQTA